MEIKSKKFFIVLVITFGIVFFMNYLGNDKPDKLNTAIMNGLGGVVGLTVGMLIYNKNKKDDTPPENFD